MKKFHLILSIFSLLCLQQLKAQTDSVYFTREMFQSQIDSLKAKHGFMKNIPAEYELPVLVALSFYPELDSIPIDFICLPIHATMEAQPRTRSLFHGRNNRYYLIFINTSRKNTGFTPPELTFNQLVGVFGHELGHISYYVRHSDLRLILDGLGYPFRYIKKHFENETDMITVDHGLGWQLLDFTDFVTNKATLSKSYARKKKITYYNAYQLYLILLNRSKIQN